MIRTLRRHTRHHNVSPHGWPDIGSDSTVDRMAVDTSAYTLPWAVWIDANGQHWIHPSYSTTQEKKGSTKLLVEHRPDGYHVWVPSSAPWEPMKGPHYIGDADIEFIPVEVHGRWAALAS